ncbi:MAG: carboxypeptidase-like regulatory domain-containing protein, partial [Cyclobacteriaceae bacterium]
MKKTLLVLLIACLSITSYGQGFLRGKIIDGETGEGLIGATVSKEGTSIGAAADFDGNFSLKLDPGMHTIVFQFVSYQTQKISDIEIKDGEVSTMDVTLKVVATELEEIVVTAEQARDTEVALLTVQRKSANVLDGISSQTFRKLGDSDLGVAMKRVTGVAVQEGKYVYVRGLGDRYTKTTFSEMSIPGLDPDNNSVQIDIFPTNTIENVIVYKTFSPNLSADFAGGTVDIETKSFPDEKVTSVSVGMGFNPAMNLNKDFLSYDGGKKDFLGFDDGTRKLPFDKKSLIPDISSADGARTEVFTRSFNPQLAAQKKP